MTGTIEGARITAAWINSNLRVFSRIDQMLPMWADTTMRRMLSEYDTELRMAKRNKLPRPAVVSLADVYYRFVRMLLCDEADLRIVNDTVFFMKNDIVRTPLQMCNSGDVSSLLRAWPLVFGTRTRVEESEAGYDYTGCLHAGVLAINIPRLVLAARFMCIQMRIEVEPCEDGIAAPYRLGAFYAFSSALSRLLVEEQTNRHAATLYSVLITRRHRTLFDWDPSLEPYPGYAEDQKN